jgi:tRNA threonylcarbamoyladenosine biosynthesis protein TsaB
MLTLAIDCALRRINIGASDGEKFLGELSADVGVRQSELLPSAVLNFISLFGKTIRDIGQIAVTVGPGYYTGIRVGLSYAAALAESVRAMLLPVSTLGAMAFGFMDNIDAVQAHAIVSPVIPASRDSLYVALYETYPGRKDKPLLLGPSHVKIDDFVIYLEPLRSSGDIVLIGSDLPVELSRAYNCLSPARDVSYGVLRAAREATPIDPASASAVYLRTPY